MGMMIDGQWQGDDGVWASNRMVNFTALSRSSAAPSGMIVIRRRAIATISMSVWPARGRTAH